jgi:hypothetical protein
VPATGASKMRDVSRGLPVDATAEESLAYYQMREAEDAAKDRARREAEEAWKAEALAAEQAAGATIGTTAASRGET